MSAAPLETKVLRVGLVRDDKLVEERVITPGESVVFGTGPSATFPVQVPGQTGDFALFLWKDGAYILQATDTVRGKVTASGAPLVLEKARRDGSLAKDATGLSQVTLTFGDKGKLTVGDAKVLFQFVSQAVVAPAPQPIAPQSFRRPLVSFEDSTFLGFILLFYSIGAAVGVWAATATIPPPSFDKYVGMIAEYQAKPPVVVEKPKEQKPEEEKPKDDTKPADAAPAEDSTPKPPKNREEAVAQARNDMQQNSELFKMLKAKLEGSLGENSSGLVVSNADAYDNGMAARLAEASNIAGSTTGGLIRTGDGPPGGDRGIGGVTAGADGRAQVSGSASVRVVKANTPDIGDIDGPADVASVGKIVRKYRGNVQFCYETSLKSNPKLSGRVVVALTVTGGVPKDVFIADNTTGDDTLSDCIRKKVMRWDFTGVEDGDAKVPFVLTSHEE
jgi:hypothetical protein